MSKREYYKEVKKTDDVMTVKDWLTSVKEGYFTNDDGSGYWVKDGMGCKDEVFSSEPEDATHVVWFNK